MCLKIIKVKIYFLIFCKQNTRIHLILHSTLFVKFRNLSLYTSPLRSIITKINTVSVKNTYTLQHSYQGKGVYKRNRGGGQCPLFIELRYLRGPNLIEAKKWLKNYERPTQIIHQTALNVLQTQGQIQGGVPFCLWNPLGSPGGVQDPCRDFKSLSQIYFKAKIQLKWTVLVQ